MYEVRDVAHSDKLILSLSLTPLYDPLSFSARLSGLKWRRLIDRQTDKAMPPAWINNVLNIFMSNCLYRLTALIWNIALGDGNCKPGNTYTNTFTDRVRQLTMIRHVILFYGNSKGEWSNSILCWDRFDIVPKRPRDSQADASCSSDVWLCTGNSNSAQIPGHSCKTASEMGA